MAKIKTKRGFRFIKELGGAIRRTTVSFGAAWLVEQGHVKGQVLDFGCGFGFDADHFGWNAFDPHYRQETLEGKYDTITCNHVLNMLTHKNRKQTICKIRELLTPDGNAFLIVPRNIPKIGKIALRKRIQNYVVLTLPSIYSDQKLEIYQMGRAEKYNDTTNEIEQRLGRD
jgi:hypothetical protein